jgi:hypothetical protein
MGASGEPPSGRQAGSQYAPLELKPHLDVLRQRWPPGNGQIALHSTRLTNKVAGAVCFPRAVYQW